MAAAAHHDVVVIGGGPAGYAAALYGASAGLDIALIEKNILGGTCLNVGCIPAKELLETASVARTVAHAADFGVEVTSHGLAWQTTLRRKQTIIDQLVGGLTGLLKNRKVTVLDGTATLGSDHRTVTVRGGASGDATLTGDAVVLAAGSVPRSLDGFPDRRSSDRDLRRAAVDPGAPRDRSGDRGRRDRMRVRFDDGRPRHRGHHPRVRPEDPAGLR